MTFAICFIISGHSFISRILESYGACPTNKKPLICLSLIERTFNEAVGNKEKNIDKIIVIFLVYQDAVNNPPIAGGCPLLNTAIKIDFGFPELRDKAAEEYNQIVPFIQSIIDEGIKSKEFKQDLDSYNLASFLVSTMEGAVMTSRLSLNNEHMLHSVEQVRILLQNYLKKNQG